MLDVLCPLITEADYVSNELLDIILINIVDPYKTQRKNAFALAKELVSKTSDTLEPYLQQVQPILIKYRQLWEFISPRVFNVLYMLYMILVLQPSTDFG